MPRPNLATVSGSTLAGAGIVLEPPIGKPSVDEAAAEATALAEGAPIGASVREIILAEFTDEHRNPPIDRLAWVVSIQDPPGDNSFSHGFPGATPPAPPIFRVVAVDAVTGAFMEGLSGN